jgi:hypothetical protein
MNKKGRGQEHMKLKYGHLYIPFIHEKDTEGILQSYAHSFSNQRKQTHYLTACQIQQTHSKQSK